MSARHGKEGITHHMASDIKHLLGNQPATELHGEKWWWMNGSARHPTLHWTTPTESQHQVLLTIATAFTQPFNQFIIQMCAFQPY